jgi:hypothetical protein
VHRKPAGVGSPPASVTPAPSSPASPEEPPDDNTLQRARAFYKQWRENVPPHEPTREWDELAYDQQKAWIDRARNLPKIEKPAKNTKKSKSLKQSIDYPPPRTETELDAIQERVAELARVAHTIASLGVVGVDAAPVQIAGLHEVSTRTEKLAREIGLQAIAEGKMSQVQLGRLLGVHQATVSRWVNEAAEKQNGQ